MKVQVFFLSCLLFCASVFADDEPQYTPIETQVQDNAIESLVNMSALPSSLVAGCVNVITGDFCESSLADTVSGPEPYPLGHSYCSSSLEEGSLGDGWNFMHYNKLEVFQYPRVQYIDPRSPGGKPIAILLPLQKAVSDEYETEYDDDSGDESQSEQGFSQFSIDDSDADISSYYDSTSEMDSDVFGTNVGKLPLDKMSNAGKVMDRSGLTKAGRALDKHGNRPGSAFPKATGNPASKNAQGQYHLDDILTHPQSTSNYYKHRSFGDIVDIEVAERGGARFSNKGEFIVFLMQKNCQYQRNGQI